MEDKKGLENIYLFTGENRFSLQQEILRRQKLFQEKYGLDSVFSFNGENRDYGNIRQTIFGGGFFITNKLIILYGIPGDTDKSNGLKSELIDKIVDDLMNIQIPSTSVVICVSYKPDKRGRFYKWMEKINKESVQKNAKVKEFKLLSERELINFVSECAKDLNMDKGCAEVILKKVGTDQYRLQSEVEKLQYWQKYANKIIDKSVVDEVCFGMTDEDIFSLIGLVLNDRYKAVEFINSLQEKGKDRNEVNGMWTWGLRNYLLIMDYLERGISDYMQIAGEMKQAPWTVSNILKQKDVLMTNKKFLNKLFKITIDAEYEIKNGLLAPEFYFVNIKKALLSE